MSHYDLFVIGGGSGGVACARRSASYGAKVAIAEASRLGGTCVIRGCVPKKLMHYGAHFSEMFEAAAAYGWKMERPKLDLEVLLEARNKEIARLNGIYRNMLDNAGVDIFECRAQLDERDASGHHVVIAGGERHTAERVLVAVGATPQLPEVPGIEHAWTSDRVLEEVYPLPDRVTVVGAGYIGLELASIFSGLGSKTTVILRGDEPLRGFDADVRRDLTEQLEAGGLVLRPGTVVNRIEKDGDVVRLDTTTGSHETDLLIYATGRTPVPNTKGIGLEALGVKMDRAGSIYVDANFETSVPGILAVGDCSDHAGNGLDSGQHDLTPVAIAEGRAIAERLFNDNPQEVAYGTIPTAVFSIPQAASVGMSEQVARDLGYDVKIFKTRFRPMFHTLTGGAQRTTMKLIVDKPSDKVLGCHMVGDDAAELIQGVAIALTAGATKAEFDATVGVHPTAGEEFVTMYMPVEA